MPLLSERKQKAVLDVYPSLLALAIALLAAQAPAQSPDTFTATGNVAHARYFHTATLLSTGKVLIAGGTQQVFAPPASEVSLSSAELYDPSTGAFAPAGDMTLPRSGHTATLLADGKVLIAGGNNSQFGSVATAELYDPATGSFTPTSQMTTARRNHTATLLNDGRILIAGGSDGAGNDTHSLASAELYDPLTGTFTSTGSMARSKYYGQATLLPNGKVLLDGVEDNGASSAELYDPATGTFKLTGAEAYPYTFAATASLLADGKVVETLLDGCDPGNEAELYDPATGTFTATGGMSALRVEHTSTLLPDGTVLIAGGGDSAVAYPLIYSYQAHSGAEVYDSSTGRFTPTGSHMVVGRTNHTATLLPDGTVLLAGGWDAGAGATAELYHPKVLVPSPTLLSLSGEGRGPGAILHAGTHLVVSSSNPAVAGEALEVYGAGLIDGSVIPPQVAIGGRMAEVLFFGKAPGFAGLNQMNVRVPSGVAPGPSVSVRLTYLTRPSNEVTIGVR